MLLAAALSAAVASGPLPEDHRALARSRSYAEMRAFLESADGRGPVHLSVEGTSVRGRSIYVVHLSHGGTPRWKVLFYAQQHGDEPSGKDALLYLVRDVSRSPDLLPRDIEAWILPMVNPDGAEAKTRGNAAGADLNRDHIALEQPETRALHRVALRVRPDVAVDVHEFGRDPPDWREKGLVKWPDITMDGLCNPLLPREVVDATERWVAESAEVERMAGHRFRRYWVGGVPPRDEQRHSAPDIDSGLHAIGMLGGLSFIVEAAVRNAVPHPEADLGERVDACLVLLRRFLAGGARRDEDIALLERARRLPLQPFLPTNYLWVNPGGAVTEFPALDAVTGAERKIATPNLMTAMAVKRSVPAPLAYAVEERAAAELAEILERHGVPFERLAAPRRVRVESARLLRVEEEFDEVYARYGGRQIVKLGPPAEAELGAGSLWVPLAGEASRRAALLLEPASLYGLYQVPRLRALAGADGVLPVLRVVGP